jgi:hypothetical protein
MMALCPRCLTKAPLFFSRDHLHHAAVGPVPPQRFIEKGLDMTKNVEQPYVTSTADKVTYVIVAGIFALAVFAFIFLQ